METKTILCWGKDTAHFLFSTAHLLLTRILPLIAMLVGSLLLNLLRLILSSLCLIWSLKTLFLKRNPSDSARHAGGRADHYALQEQEFDPQELMGAASAVQNVPDLHRQLGERFEDRFDANFIGRQRLMLKQFEDMNRTRVTTTTNRERSQAASAGELLKQQRLSGDQCLQGRPGDLLRSNQGGRPVHLRPLPGETLRQSGVRGYNSDRQIGFSAEQEIETNDLAGMHGSQPRSGLFMSDLPSTLDDVVQAAKADAERSRRRGDQAPSSALPRRSIPPTLSNVQKALQQEMRAEENQLHAAPAPYSQAQHATPANHHRASTTASYENFFTKFAEHFKLDRK